MSAKESVIKINGVTKTCQEWGRISGVAASTIYSRYKQGWNEERMLNPSSNIKALESDCLDRLVTKEEYKQFNNPIFVGGYDDDFVTASEGEIF